MRETIISWSAVSLGNEIEEKIGIVELDKYTNEPGWVASKVDELDNIIVNNNHKNKWIIDDLVPKGNWQDLLVKRLKIKK